ncbi:hypothetical protein GALL_463760 [mine drainage metagenome]|uniref:Uncharacterized protein n=1 Tax=mine drainage metagenome TaxID=410659 RepID=A0A1J5PLG7_9ZZZZ
MGSGQHAGVENFKFRFDSVRLHGHRKHLHVSGVVHEHVTTKIDGTHGQGGHFRLERHRGQAFLRCHADRTAGGHLNDHIAAGANRSNDLSIGLFVLGRTAIGMARMHMHDGGTGQGAFMRSNRNFLGRDGQRRLLFASDFSAGQGCGNDKFFHSSTSLLCGH